MSWPQRLLVTSVGYVVAVVTLVWLAQRHTGWVLVVASLLLAAAALLVHFWLNHPDPPPFAWHLNVAEAMMLVGVGFLGAWKATNLEGLGFIGLVTLFLGLGELMAALRSSPTPSTNRLVPGLTIVATSAVVFVAGLLFLPTGDFWPVVACVSALVVSPIGLGLLTEEVVDRDLMGRVDARARNALGVALVALGGVAIGLGGAGWTRALWIPLVLFALMGAIASNTNADIVAVGLVALVALGNTPAPAELPPSLTPAHGNHVVVVFGDSYTSGEGAKTFFTNTNVHGVNTCRRSPTAYGANLKVPAPNEEDRTVFIACSGAVAEEVWLRSQQPQEPVDWTDPVPSSPLRPGLPQIASFLSRNSTPPEGPDLALTPDLVIIGIGGNDAGFGDVVQTCVAPGDCSEVGAEWLENLPDVLASLSTAFDELEAAFPGTPVLVVPYPVPISAKGCNWSAFTANEHHFLNAFTKELVKVQQAAAAEAQFMYLDSMPAAFESRRLRICDGSPDTVGVNLLVRNSVRGDLEQTSDVQNWVHNSMHPNETGQAAMTDVVNLWLENHPDFDAAPPTPSPAPYRPATLAEVMQGTDWEPCPAGDDCTPSSAWVQTEARNTLLKVGLPLLAILTGAWVLWLWLIAWGRELATWLDAVKAEKDEKAAAILRARAEAERR